MNTDELAQLIYTELQTDFDRHGPWRRISDGTPNVTAKRLADRVLAELAFRPDEMAHLSWLRERLINVYGVSPNIDYVLKLDEIIERHRPSEHRVPRTMAVGCPICGLQLDVPVKVKMLPQVASETTTLTLVPDLSPIEAHMLERHPL